MVEAAEEPLKCWSTSDSCSCLPSTNVAVPQMVMTTMTRKHRVVMSLEIPQQMLPQTQQQQMPAPANKAAQMQQRRRVPGSSSWCWAVLKVLLTVVPTGHLCSSLDGRCCGGMSWRAWQNLTRFVDSTPACV